MLTQEDLAALLAFLKARLSEYEQAARRSLDSPAGALRFADVDEWTDGLIGLASEDFVLRDVEAKRQVVDAYEAQVAERQRLGVLRDAELAKGDELAPEVARLTGSGIGVNSWIDHLGWVVRVIAATYAGHPDYDEEWRP